MHLRVATLLTLSTLADNQETSFLKSNGLAVVISCLKHTPLVKDKETLLGGLMDVLVEVRTYPLQIITQHDLMPLTKILQVHVHPCLHCS
jgi:hypothetical protein